MKKKTVIEHFGGVLATAKALGITSQSVSQWPEEIPELRAFQIERLTNGLLTVAANDAAQNSTTN